jgi:hypothetical protein
MLTAGHPLWGIFVMDMIADASCDWCSAEMQADQKAQWL